MNNISELAKIKQQLRNEKTKYNNQRNRSKKYKELYVRTWYVV